VTGDAGANLGRGLAEPGLLVGVKAFLRAGGALGAVQSLKATAQAGVAQRAVAAAVAGELISDVADLGNLLVDMHLPGITEVVAAEFCAGEDGRQRADLERGRGVVGGHVAGRVGPLRVAARGERKDGQAENPAIAERAKHSIDHGKTLSQLLYDAGGPAVCAESHPEEAARGRKTVASSCGRSLPQHHGAQTSFTTIV